MSRLAALTLAVALLACGSPSKPYRLEVFGLDLGTKQYGFRVATLPTLDDLDALRGGAGTIEVAGSIPVSPFAGAPHTEQDWRDSFAMRGSEPPRVAYSVEDEVVVAQDYETLALFSVYAELEQAQAFFRGAGVAEALLPPMPVYYDANLSLLGVLPMVTDNAAFTAFVGEAGAFLLFPQSLKLGSVPLALNLGVLTHEYGHAVMSRALWRGHLPRSTIESWPEEPSNVLRALDEGMADFFGATHTGDPNFIGLTVDSVAEERNLSVPRIYDPEALPSLRAGVESYDPYALGSVLASAWWEIGARLGVERTAQLTVQFEAALGLSVSPSVSLASILDLFIATAQPGTERSEVCAVLRERMALALFEGACP